MFPAQALAEAMLARGWRVKLSTDARGARYTGGFPHAVEIEQVGSATFARGGIAAKLMVPFKIAGGSLAAVTRMLRDKPAVVVGFGGYPSIPALTAATLLRRPRMIHEQNGVLGRVNQLFAKRVQKVACGTWPTDLPDGVDGVPVGNPVRGAILERAGAGYTQPPHGPRSRPLLGYQRPRLQRRPVIPLAKFRTQPYRLGSQKSGSRGPKHRFVHGSFAAYAAPMLPPSQGSPDTLQSPQPPPAARAASEGSQQHTHRKYEMAPQFSEVSHPAQRLLTQQPALQQHQGNRRYSAHPERRY